jgi:hypothetical protein
MTANAESIRPQILTVEDFLKISEATDIFKRVNQEIIEESKNNPIDESAINQARDWSILANQVVGAESF